MLKKIGRYIQQENDSVYVPRGLMLVDPSERGLRVVSLCVTAYKCYICFIPTNKYTHPPDVITW